MRITILIALWGLFAAARPVPAAPALTSPSAVDLEVVPGPDGLLGQWLVTAPVKLPGYGHRATRLRASPSRVTWARWCPALRCPWWALAR